ncbi:PREDICTED: eukaryotic translation initiation factor 4G-like isoform X1 [Lupinus angustifolius]|uniref:eukaryotic translation initiation factor 4G-like isoform X1 n=1 Tax=Lupinus angustifolius TaxID=3871 RepID=UPI00092E5F22|nr:PREDICTED: eukaryotic translation initiation factor 4G-like isoform X1 [Lupinus angustifolius]
MSFNQSKSDKSEAVYRKSGRSGSFNQHRGSSASYVKAGDGPASSARSFNKKPNNAQGGQSRVNPTTVNSTEANANRNIQNATNVRPQLHGAPDASVTTKLSESSAAPRSSVVVPKAPTSQLVPPISSDSAAPTTPSKGDVSKAFPFQFGSISPGFMNGMAIPARTSSAPPNIDEQKRDQALRSVPSGPTPPVPKQHQPPRKDAVVTEKSNSVETHTITKGRKDPQVSASTPAVLIQKPSVVPVTGISMPMPYHHSPASLQFGGPTQQIQPQGMSITSLQMPIQIPIPIGNASQVQQQVFVPGLQSHPMHHQGIMHPGQNMSFNHPMGHHLSHQLGSMGIGPQYPQQQGGQFAPPRKTTTVKITHPETHEELRLDKKTDAYSDGGTSGVRSHPSRPSQSQPVQSLAASHPMNYYSSSFNTGSIYFPPPSSLPPTSVQITPNPKSPRFNYPVNHGPQIAGFKNSSSLGSPPVNKASTPIIGIVETHKSESSRDVPNALSSAPLGVTSVPIKTSGASAVVDSSSPISSISGVQNRESSSAASYDTTSFVPQKGSETCTENSSQQSKLASDSSVLCSLPKQSSASVAVPSEKVTAAPLTLPSSSANEDSVLVVSNNEGIRNESLSRSNSLKDKPLKKGQLQHQVSVKSPMEVNVSSQAVDSGISYTGVSEPAGTETNYSVAVNAEVLPSSLDTISAISSSIPSAVEVKTNFSADVSACVSTEGSDVQGADSLNNHKHDNLGHSSEEVKQTDQDAATVSTEMITLKTVQKQQDESASCSAGYDNAGSQSADLPETTSILVKGSSENAGSDSVSHPVSGNKDRQTSEANKVNTTSKARKKRKEILQKADAAGSISDLYNAYTGPEEKKEAILSSESTENDSTSGSLEQLPADSVQSGDVASEKCGASKTEPDDWEDAADMSTPKLEVADKSNPVSDESGGTIKKYSRDFLLKFSEQCTDLPEGFESADFAELRANITGGHVIERDSHHNPGRNVDRSGGMSRMDRRGGGMNEEDKWNKVSGAFHYARGFDGIGGNAGFRAGQGGNVGVLRNPRAQAHLQYAGGVLSDPMQSMGNQGGMQRASLDGERWQRSASFQRGLIPSPTTPQTPLQMMHKAENKYEVGKIPDEEQAKQRQLKAILNKLTPQNFERLFEQVKAVNIDNAVTLTGVISQIFEKALMEPTFCEMYANFCSHLASELPDLSEGNEKITFKRLLLNKCQEEFERGVKEQEEANKADEGEVKQSDEEREERRVKARRRMLGNIRLIGELYKKRMLTERIMHECIKKLLGQYQDPDEEDIEALCKLMSTIGEMIDHPKAKVHIDAYFERIRVLSNNMNLSSRLRFMLKDAIDLRKNKWQQRRKVEGPKKIEEVHRDAVQERQAQAQAGRMGRGPGSSPSARRNPMDFGPRGSSMLSSPTAQMGGLRGLPTQVRGYGSQDARFEERQSYEARTLSVPLPQRTLADNSITLGPQGGLARGMSIRGSTVISSSSTSDGFPVPRDSHRMATGLNGYNNLQERTPYNSREDLASRYTVDRFSGPDTSDQSSALDRDINYGNRDLRNVDRNLDRPVASSPPAQSHVSTVSQNDSSEKAWPEERLLAMSMAAIREYYSARDDKEVALCIKELNSPSFHPSMVSLWVTDSFERKDTERDLLAKLLVNLVKSPDGILSQVHLVKGFESVLSTLEDAVNDAPRAPEFLGRIFAKALTESVVSLTEIGRLIHDGGEEPGSLLEAGLAANVLGWTLESIQSEKGEAVLNEIRSSSNLRLETFRPPNPITSRKLEKFISG